MAAPEKGKYDFLIPVFCAAFLWVGYQALEPRPLLFGEGGLLPITQSFLLMAVPFLIGALAAVAMGAPGQSLDRRANGVDIYLDGEILSIRQFVCLLLGYLSFLGLVLLLVITLTVIAQPALGPITNSSLVGYYFRQVALALFLLGISAFIVTVFWALYFLTDVVNRRDRH